MGRILRVDLTRGSCLTEDLDPDMARAFVGGRGLSSKLLFDEVDPMVEPLSPENKLILATGPLTGTGAITGCRYMVVTKSPLTGVMACSNAGGYFGPELKFAGYDLIILEGRSHEPVYLSIVNDNVNVRPAHHLWGKSTVETESLIRSDIGNAQEAPRTQIASIGPAGENLVRMACVINAHRAAARSGVGAVMGSKNLKAVAVRGTGRPVLADKEGFRKASLSFMDRIRKEKPFALEARIKYGTWRIIEMMLLLGMLPTRNFTAGSLDGVIAIDDIRKEILVKEKSCFGCPFRCGRVTRVSDPEFQGEGEGPEHESFTQLGPCCGIIDLAAITKANYLCNELGMDTISTGVTIACAMELYERGYMPSKDVPFPINFGDKHAMVKLVEMIAAREGIGDLLAEGSYRLARHYGHPEISMSVKGQEMPALHPQGYQGLGLAYATSNSGACHTRSNLNFERRSETKGQASLIKEGQDFVAVVDSSGLCWSIFGGLLMLKDELVTQLKLATGVDYNERSMMLAGERIFNLERLFSLKAGITGSDDTLPSRMLEEPMLKGQAEGQVVRLAEMLPEYYRLREWDRDGVPTSEKLAQLKLS
ncbi:MAG: aldehyde ferredoxin oxidoreductase family protein [Dehalococcoidia bacterium]